MPIGLINYDTGEVIKVDELVERYFPTGELIPKQDWFDIRNTAYRMYLNRVRTHEQPDELFAKSVEDWNLAMRLVAIRKYLEV